MTEGCCEGSKSVSQMQFDRWRAWIGARMLGSHPRDVPMLGMSSR